MAIPSDFRLALVGDATNIPDHEVRHAYERRYDFLVPPREGDTTELDRHRTLVAALGVKMIDEFEVFTDTSDHEFAAGAWAREGDWRGTIALFPGAQQPIRTYGYFRDVLMELHDYRFVIFGADDADNTAREISRGVSPERCINLVGRTSLTEMAACFQRADLYLGTESSGAHIACAMGLKNIVLLGGGHFGRLMPYSQLTTCISVALDCFYCNWHCSRASPICIRLIQPELISRVVRRVHRETLPNGSDKPTVVWDLHSRVSPNFESLDELHIQHATHVLGPQLENSQEGEATPRVQSAVADA